MFQLQTVAQGKWETVIICNMEKWRLGGLYLLMKGGQELGGTTPRLWMTGRGNLIGHGVGRTSNNEHAKRVGRKGVDAIVPSLYLVMLNDA